ncbi:MAG: DNA polymerase I [Thermoguttaceae bacterium]
MTGKTVFVLDAHGILHQLFHALPEMTSPQGEPVGAVFGFARDLIALLSQHRPDYFFCAYDLPGGTFRNRLYAAYKENRKAMPDSLRPQIAASREVLDAFDVPVLAQPDFEADDVLATIARLVEEKGGHCVLITNDKDARQLLSDHVSIYLLRKQEYYTEMELMSDWGITPNQVVDFQSLVGDSSDNVPGIPLIGPKIATELLGRFGTLENVLDHASEISGSKRKQNLLEGREIALLSRELVRLRNDVPLEVNWDAGKFVGVDPGKLWELFQRFGFRSLLAKFPDLIAKIASKPLEDFEKTSFQPQPARSVISPLQLLASQGEPSSTPKISERLGYSTFDETGKKRDSQAGTQTRSLFDRDEELPESVNVSESHFVPTSLHAGQSGEYEKQAGLWGAGQIDPKHAELPVHFDAESADPKNARLPVHFGTESVDSENVGRLRTGDTTSLRGFGTQKTGAIQARYHLVDREETFEEFLEQLKEQCCFSFDSETTDVRPRFAQIVGLSFCWDSQNAWYLPFRGPLGSDCLDAKKVLAALKPILENAEIGKIGQNLKYDGIVLQNVGIGLKGVRFDTMIADYLLRTGEQLHNLDSLAEHYLNHTTIKIGALIGSGKKQKKMNEIPTDLVGDYAGEDALIPWLLAPILEEQIRGNEQWEQLYYDYELPVAEILQKMEFAGIAIDVDLLHTLSVRFAKRLDELEREIHELAGSVFNVASPKQLQKVLFEDLRLPVIKKTKTGPSTDIEVLEELLDHHAIAAKIIDYRQTAKLKGTYVDALPQMIHPQTGRIHTSFNQVVTATGRLSSSDPNLQNIPIRTDEGREIRSAFIPAMSEGFDRFLSCDYSQIELRVLAHFSGDETLCAAFQKGEDIHASVASEVFNVAKEEITPEMRRCAKAVNFGIIYGQSAFGLAKQLGISQEEAASFISAYFEKYAAIHDYMESILTDCHKNGYVSTLLGRRREIFGVRSIRKSGQLTLPERTAINTVIQGSAADLVKAAMIQTDRVIRLQQFRSRLLLQIHDELVFETNQNELESLQKAVVREMQLNQPLAVPLVVDSKIGTRWT